MFDLDGIRQEVLHTRHRVQLVADDLHVGALQADLLFGFTQHRLTKAVVLPDQVNAFKRLVVLEHIHQSGHAHVGMRVKTKVPEAALFVGQGRLHRRVIEKQHPLGRLALVVLVDGVNQHRCGGRRIALRNDAYAVVDGRAQCGKRLFVLALAVVTLDAQRLRTRRQLDAATRIDALSGPHQVAKDRFTRVAERTGKAFNQGDTHSRRGALGHGHQRQTGRQGQQAKGQKFQTVFQKNVPQASKGWDLESAAASRLMSSSGQRGLTSKV